MKPTNLNKARKNRARTKAKAKAEENVARFGRTKAQKVLEATQAAQATARLSQLKFEVD